MARARAPIVKGRLRNPRKLTYQQKLARLRTIRKPPFRAKTRLKGWQKSWVTKQWYGIQTKAKGRRASSTYKRIRSRPVKQKIKESKVVTRFPPIKTKRYKFSSIADVFGQPLWRIIEYIKRKVREGMVVMITGSLMDVSPRTGRATKSRFMSTPWEDLRFATEADLMSILAPFEEITSIRFMPKP